MKQVELLAAVPQDLVVGLEADVDRGGGEVRLVPVGGRQDRVAFFDGAGVQLVGGQPAAEAVPEIGRRTDVIDVAVREDHRGDFRRVESRPLDVAHQRAGAPPGSRVDHDEIA